MICAMLLSMKETIIKTNPKVEKAIAQFKKIVDSMDGSEKATLELMLDPEAQRDLAKSLDDSAKGRIIPWEDIKKGLK